jgi:hypothetical protein
MIGIWVGEATVDSLQLPGPRRALDRCEIGSAP